MEFVCDGRPDPLRKW